MIRIMTKLPNGEWFSCHNAYHTEDSEKIYAKELVASYQKLLDNGFILCFTVEIQTTVGNDNFVEVIGYGGM